MSYLPPQPIPNALVAFPRMESWSKHMAYATVASNPQREEDFNVDYVFSILFSPFS